jgi:hypothetical protein
MKPETYDEDVKNIRHIQTHVSHIFLTGVYAYKVKKPVNFGFLDFTTLKKRKKYCELEVFLNRRLCDDMYIGVLPITKHKNKIKINGEGKIVEYTVKMKEFPQERIMSNLLKNNSPLINLKLMSKIGKIVAEFHSNAEKSEHINKVGFHGIKFNWDENFSQTKEFIGKTIDKTQYEHIKKAINSIVKNKKMFKQRIKEEKFRDCHGDMHSGNIFVMDKIYIFDAIEFNERFRYSDVASDVAFLSMDLDYYGRKKLSEYFVEKYIEYSKDHQLLNFLNFYKCLKAYVRGKVLSLKLKDPLVPKKEKEKIEEMAREYFNLAYDYVWQIPL